MKKIILLCFLFILLFTNNASAQFYGGLDLGLHSQQKSTLFDENLFSADDYKGSSNISFGLSGNLGYISKNIPFRFEYSVAFFPISDKNTEYSGYDIETTNYIYNFSLNSFYDHYFNEKVGIYMGASIGYLVSSAITTYSKATTVSTGYLIATYLVTSHNTGISGNLACGISYRWTEQVSLDFGYRYYYLNNGLPTITISQANTGDWEVVDSGGRNINTSKFLLGLRFYL